jgi:hypothetical protein
MILDRNKIKIKTAATYISDNEESLQTLSAAVTTEATFSLLKFCKPEIICRGHNKNIVLKYN